MTHEAAVIALAYARARLAAARMRVAETQAAEAERAREVEEAERVLSDMPNDEAPPDHE